MQVAYSYREARPKHCRSADEEKPTFLFGNDKRSQSSEGRRSQEDVEKERSTTLRRVTDWHIKPRKLSRPWQQSKREEELHRELLAAKKLLV